MLSRAILKGMNKNVFQSLKIIALTLVLSVSISYVSAWTAPTVTPPNGNVAAPINVSGNDQSKLGSIAAASFLDSNDPANFFVNPNNDSILKNAYIRGVLNVSTGASSGKVLTSDASGNATWQTPASSGVTSLTAGSGISLSGSTGAVTVSSTGGGTGLRGVLAPLKNKTIFCTMGVYTAYASVDANGDPSFYDPLQYRWVSGMYYYTNVPEGTNAQPEGHEIVVDSTKLYFKNWIGGGTSACYALWPAT